MCRMLNSLNTDLENSIPPDSLLKLLMLHINHSLKP